MFDIHKMLTLLLRINLSQILTIFRGSGSFLKISKKKILGGVILVYNRYSKKPVCNLTKRRNLPPVFFWLTFPKCMAVDSCFWTVEMKDFQQNILGGAILLYNRYSEWSVCNLFKRRTIPPAFSRKIFEKGWLWTAASE